MMLGVVEAVLVMGDYFGRVFPRSFRLFGFCKPDFSKCGSAKRLRGNHDEPATMHIEVDAAVMCLDLLAGRYVYQEPWSFFFGQLL